MKKFEPNSERAVTFSAEEVPCYDIMLTQRGTWRKPLWTEMDKESNCVIIKETAAYAAVGQAIQDLEEIKAEYEEAQRRLNSLRFVVSKFYNTKAQ